MLLTPPTFLTWKFETQRSNFWKMVGDNSNTHQIKSLDQECCFDVE